MKYLWLFVLTLISCASENELHEPFDAGIDCDAAEVWICHNPGSFMHGKECTPECMERGNPHKFCWLEEEK